MIAPKTGTNTKRKNSILFLAPTDVIMQQWYEGFSQIHQQPPRVLERLLDPHQKRHRAFAVHHPVVVGEGEVCLLYTSPSPRD